MSSPPTPIPWYLPQSLANTTAAKTAHRKQIAMSESLALVVIGMYNGGGDASVAGVAIEGSGRLGSRFQQVDEWDMSDEYEPSSA